MAQLIVRNLDESLVRLLKQRAAAKGVSVESEHRRILEEALKPPAAEAWLHGADLLRAQDGRTFSDSAVIIRQERDRLSGKGT